MHHFKTMDWRLVDSDLISPEDSSARDEAILEARIQDLVPNTIHFYRRNQPTVSLGYFQKIENSVASDFCILENIKLLRRISGGSAIYTDDKQLIYAVVLKEDLGTVPESYKNICEAVILGLSFMGIKAKFKPENDILVGGKKISGNAQLRRQGAVLQHGTILMDANFDTMFKALKVPESKYKPHGLKSPIQKMTSLKQEGYEFEMDELKQAVAKGFEQYFNVKIKKSNLTKFEKKLVKKLIKEKYKNVNWNLKC
jgi:lipoate-protein ligase A